MAFSELVTSPVETYAATGFTATRQFKGPWAEREDFVEEILEDPTYPGKAAVAVSRIRFKPEGCIVKEDPKAVTSLPTFSDDAVCFADVEYSSNEDNQIETQQQSQNKWKEKGDKDSYFTLSASSYMEVLELSTKETLKFLRSPIPVRDPENPNRTLEIFREGDAYSRNMLLPIGGTNYNITWHRVDQVPWFAFSQLRGTVNAEPFKIPVADLQVPPWCLRFDDFTCDVEISYQNRLDPVHRWKVQLTLAERNLIGVPVGRELTDDGPSYILSTGLVKDFDLGKVVGWNHFFNDKRGVWQILAYRVKRTTPTGTYVADDIKPGIFTPKNWAKLLRQGR